MLIPLQTNSPASTQENARQQFIEKFGDRIEGVLSGFDRLIFRGSLRRLNYGRWDSSLQAPGAVGMEQYLWQNQILFKQYGDHVKRASERLKKESLRPFEQGKLPVVFWSSPKVDKDALARRLAAEKGTQRGPVCALSTMEPSPTLEHRGTHIIGRVRDPATCCITTKSMRCWVGCMRASRRGFRSTSKLGSTAGNGWLGRWIKPV